MSPHRLVEELGAALPPGVAALPPADLDVLADLLARARHEQARALAEAIERGLAFIPRLVRGPVRRVLVR